MTCAYRACLVVCTCSSRFSGSPHVLTKHKLVFDNLYANGVGCICRVEGQARLKKPLSCLHREAQIRHDT